MTLYRTGILGCGNFAHRHAQILSALPDQVEMVAFCDRDETKARAFADQYRRAAVWSSPITTRCLIKPS